MFLSISTETGIKEINVYELQTYKSIDDESGKYIYYIMCNGITFSEYFDTDADRSAKIAVISNLNPGGGGSGGTSTDVKINGTSITSGDTANIAVEGTYNASTNKLMTKSEVDGYDASWIYTRRPSVADFNAFYNYVDNGGIRVYFTSQNDDNEINTGLVEKVMIGETGDEKYIDIYSQGDLLQLVCDGTQVAKKVVPTNISSFTNDSNYQNATQVQTAINNAIGTALGGSY